MEFDVVMEYPQRKSNRLRSYDYSSGGYYYVTICTKNGGNFLASIKDGNMKLSRAGIISRKYWVDIPSHYDLVELDEYVIMPNHLHGIIIIKEGKTVNRQGTLPNNSQKRKHNKISKVIRTFKTLVKREIIRKAEFINFEWQRSFYDHVIRNSESLAEIRKYIKENPIKWHLDKYFSA
jgi:putative transposase